MPAFDLRSAISSFVGGRETDSERHAIRKALEDGRIALASGERSVAVGGNIEGAIITGDNNLVLSLDQAGFETVQRMFGDLLRTGLPQPPLYLPVLTVSEGDAPSRYHYASGRVTFRGRVSELNKLIFFAKESTAFLWWSIIAPAGHGKSRLAYEFMNKLNESWRSGFLPPGHGFSEHWNRWQPRCPTIIAIDDASVRSTEINEIIRALAPRDAKNHEAHLEMPVRLLAIDRHDLWFADLHRDRHFWADHGQRTLHDPKPVSLGQLSDEDMRAILSEVAGPEGVQAVLDAGRYGDVNSTILMGLILADEVNRDGQIDGRDRTGLIRDLLRQTDESLWTTLGVTEDDRALLTLATMLGQIRFADLRDPALIGVVPDRVDRKIVDRLGRMVGSRLNDRLFALKPDLIGELFVLDTLEEFLRFGDPRAEGLPAAAWRRDYRSVAATLRRASEDFPQHPMLKRILISPLSDDVSDWSSWTGLLLQQVLDPSALTAEVSREEIWGKTIGALTAFRNRVPRHQAYGYLARAAISAMTLHSDVVDEEWVERAFSTWWAFLNDPSANPSAFLESALTASSLIHCELPAPVEDEEDLRIELGQLISLTEERGALLAEILAQHSTPESYLVHLLGVSEQKHPATHAVLAMGDALGIFAAMYHKARFKRRRPFRKMPSLLPPIMPQSIGSYPGGHATRSHLMARGLITVIAQQEVKNVLLLLANRISRNREVAGLNYPSDSAAGAALAESLTPVLSLPINMALMADAKAEWA